MSEVRGPVVLRPGEGRHYAMGGMSAVFKADGVETAELYSISEWWLEPRTRGPGPHSHPEDDVFYVLEGVMSFLVADEWIDCPRGSFVLAPAGATHDFENRGEVRAGVLNISAPGGFERNMGMIVDWFARNPPGRTDPVVSGSRPDVHIRAFRPGDEDALRQVFASSIHGLARHVYSPAQLAAWAPEDYDRAAWAAKLAAMQPFVATVDGRVAGYADLTGTGLIDHFFVSAEFPRRGVGSALMAHVLDEARKRGLQDVTAHVSLAAEAFFARHGFEVVRRQTVPVRGVPLDNAVMERALAAGQANG